ncbi:MAG: flagellar basal-body MS-ring/collar protein FliF [Bryobacteraceae bacterium]
MDQIKRLLESLTWKQTLSLVLAAAAVIGGLTVFSRWNRERDFRPLYSSLAPEDAAAVLAKVRESGSEFRLSENGSVVLVPSARVAELRLLMAGAGLPKSGRIGFELFDKSTFGMSDFTEQVNFHRALEGELERSVMSLAEVEQARVHITFPKDSLFLDSRQPAKASVLVKLRAGAQLSPQNVAAICQLAASAVDGLLPEAVSVVDMRGNLLNRARKASSPDDPEPSEEALEYRQKLEHDLLAKISHTLEPLLGAEKFRATASVECDFSSADQSEESYDPSKSVIVTSQKTEDISGGAAAAGVPGTASTLPRPNSRPGSGNAVTRRTENVSYQSSHTVRHVREPQGTVKRMSVSLLVDSDVRYEGVGAKAKRIVEAPSADRLKAIHDLVAGVIGLSTERGDQLVVETLPFESTLNPEQLPAAKPAPPPPASWQDQFLKNRVFVIGVAAGAALLLALLFIVVRVMRKKAPHGSIGLPGELPPGSPDELQGQIENRLAEQAAQRQKQETDALNALKLPPVTKKAAVLTKHITEQAKKDSASMAHVLRAWMSESGDEVKH